MEDIYAMTDAVILSKIGARLKLLRLKQNITQESLSEAANVSLSVIKKVEKGEIRSSDVLLRLLRTLGQLEVLLPLVEEQQLSPSEYYELMNKSEAHLRKRASGKIKKAEKEDSEW
jgi:transcriptional regulator with XRE-family HTH domain